jgi:hypothetical protein
MNCQNIVIALSLSIALSHCGSNPIACACHEVQIVSAANGSPVAGAVPQFVGPLGGATWYELYAGMWQANGPFCETAPFEFEISHPAYQTQRVRYTPPRDLRYDNCTTRRPPALVVRLQPQ